MNDKTVKTFLKNSSIIFFRIFGLKKADLTKIFEENDKDSPNGNLFILDYGMRIPLFYAFFAFLGSLVVYSTFGYFGFEKIGIFLSWLFFALPSSLMIISILKSSLLKSQIDKVNDFNHNSYLYQLKDIDLIITLVASLLISLMVF